jgi:3-hydroxy-9,10-secoandrosta-1,3,5(10)-triene-9,17-dione monooxygenase
VNLTVRIDTAPDRIPAPEPDMTRDRLCERAVALRPLLRAQQEEADILGRYTPEVHQAFLDAGFYRITQPRMFGGYELDLETYFRLIVEIARGHPATGWCLALGASHAWVVASHWPEQAQREVFGPDGHFIAPHRPAAMGKLTPTPGGAILNGQWNYCSGIPYSTHLLCGAMLEQPDGPAVARQVLIPRSDYTILEDWGDDRTLGMRASGSHSARATDVFVPQHRIIQLDWLGARPDGMEDGTPGTRLHGNPMYLGRMMGPYHCSLVSPVVGAAWAALDEFEALMLRNRALSDPSLLWADSVEYQRPFGLALSMTEAAETILFGVAAKYRALCDRWGRDRTPISVEDNLRLWALAQQAGGLARQAIELLFQNSLSAPTKKGSRLRRYFSDAAMYSSHVSSQQNNQATYVARAHFGRPTGFRGL